MTHLIAPPARSSEELTADINAALAAWVGTAPSNLDTLSEIAERFGDDEDVVTALISTVGGKVDKSLLDAKGDLLVATGDDTPAKLTRGADGQLLSADSTDDKGLKWVNPPSSVPSWESLLSARPNSWGAWYANANAALVTGFGFVFGIAPAGLGTLSSPENSAAKLKGPHDVRATIATINNDAGLSWNSFSPAAEYNSVLLMEFEMIDLADIRFFAGWSSGQLQQCVDADNASQDVCGLSFSTARPDTTFQWLTKSTANGVARTNTGVAPVAGTRYILEVKINFTGNWTATLYSGAMTVLHTSAAIAPPYPAFGYRPVIGLRNLTGVSKSLRIFRAHIYNRAGLT